MRRARMPDLVTLGSFWIYLLPQSGYACFVQIRLQLPMSARISGPRSVAEDRFLLFGILFDADCL